MNRVAGPAPAAAPARAEPTLVRHVEIRRGVYRDSVRLMQVSAALTGEPGVDRALVAMATPLNQELLVEMGFEAPTGAGPNDLLVALTTTTDQARDAALVRLDAELTAERKGSPLTLHPRAGAFPDVGTAAPPRTTAAAVRGLDAPAVVLVSTPGEYAFIEAVDALDAGRSVMLFSDNVPIAQEISLKQTAAERGLLVMGPDCGTAVIAGLGLGFANVVPLGPVGLVAASGTGAQQVMCLLAAAGVGTSHCLGVGGRDLSAAVAGLSTHAALDALDADPATELIVLVAKPPEPDVAAAVGEHARRLTTPVLIAPLGLDRADLTAVVTDVLRRLGSAVPRWPVWPPTGDTSPTGDTGAGAPGGRLRGLFSGGTLCVEAMAIAAPALGPIRSNIPLRPEWRLGHDGDGGRDHVMLDLGSDEFTAGRPHPMIDFGPRLERLALDAADARCRVLLLDAVLGHGAHPDPAGQLAPAIERALAARDPAHPLSVIVSLVGTAADPQDLERQAARLQAAGAWSYLSNAAAARHAVQLAANPTRAGGHG